MEFYAAKYDISSTTLYNLVEAESMGSTTVVSGNDRGALQINKVYHPEVSDECAFDLDCSLDWASQRISKGYLYEWTSANCYQYVQALLHVKLPLAKDLKPNSMPHKGSVAIYDYHGTPHYAVVTEVAQNGFWERGTNLEPAKPYKRFVAWNYAPLRGFWSPSLDTPTPSNLASSM